VVLENIQTPTTEGIGNSEEEGGLKAKIFKGKYEPKLEFPEVGGSNPQNPTWVEYMDWLFSGTTH